MKAGATGNAEALLTSRGTPVANQQHGGNLVLWFNPRYQGLLLFEQRRRRPYFHTCDLFGALPQ
jgi:hypothetical protein